MKKWCMIMAVFMLFSILLTVGCDGERETSDDGNKITTNENDGSANVVTKDAEPVWQGSKPNEYVQEKLDAGEDVLIACSMLADVPVLMEVFAGDIESVIEPYGFNWQLTHAGGDAATMISQIENFSLMGAACIICVPPDAGTVKDAVLAAMDAGSDVVLYGVTGVDYCYSVRPDSVKLGAATSTMALAWIEQRFPDASADAPVKVAAMYSSSVVDSQKQGEAMTEVIEGDERVKLVYTEAGSEGSVDSGYDIAQSALTYDSGIRVMVSTQGTDALGASNYIMAQPGLDYSQYGVFGGGCDTAGLDSIANLAANDEAVLRGSMEYVLTAGQSIGEGALIALFDKEPCPYEYLMEGYAYVQPGFDFEISIR